MLTYVVIRTESATFPLAMNVATFDAWHPGQHATKIRPVARGAESFRVWESKIDVRGLCMIYILMMQNTTASLT